MGKQNKHYHHDIILQTVRWYIRYNLSFHDVMERGFSVVHTLVMRWVHQYGPKIRQKNSSSSQAKQCLLESRRNIYQSKGLMGVSIPYCRSEGKYHRFLSKQTRNHQTAKRFFKTALQSFHISEPRVVTVYKNPAYLIVVEKVRKEKKMPLGIQIRHMKYHNNIVEQDYRFIKK